METSTHHIVKFLSTSHNVATRIYMTEFLVRSTPFYVLHPLHLYTMSCHPLILFLYLAVEILSLDVITFMPCIGPAPRPTPLARSIYRQPRCDFEIGFCHF